jgi:chloramphenicol 3-O phosphotransferase
VAGRVVLLNGPSSGGKSTLAIAIQEAMAAPWLRLGLDAFLDYVPERLVNVGGRADEGFRFRPADDDPESVTRITVGRYGQRVVRGMHSAVAALAHGGLDVIVDDLLLERSWLDDWTEALVGIDVVFVGVSAPLDVVEARELARGDRFPRLARGHYDIVHHEGIYDLLIDTSVHDASAGARLVVERLASGAGDAFDRIRAAGRPLPELA